MRDLVKHVFRSAEIQGDNFFSIFCQASILQKNVEEQLQAKGRLLAFTRAYFEGYPLHVFSYEQEEIVNQVSNHIESLSSFRFNLLPPSSHLYDINTMSSARLLVAKELEGLIESDRAFLYNAYYNAEINSAESIQAATTLLHYVKSLILDNAIERKEGSYLDILSSMYTSVSEAFVKQYNLPVLKKEFLSYNSTEFKISKSLMPITKLVYITRLAQVMINEANLGNLGKDILHLQEITDHFVEEITNCLEELAYMNNILTNQEDYITSLLDKVAKDLKEEYLVDSVEEIEVNLSDESYFSHISTTSIETEHPIYRNSRRLSIETAYDEEMESSFLGLESLDESNFSDSPPETNVASPTNVSDSFITDTNSFLIDYGNLLSTVESSLGINEQGYEFWDL